MRFTPKNDEQIAQEEKERKEKFLWPAKTVCSYEIEGAIEKTSKNGNEMIQLSVKVYRDDGAEQVIHDYIGDWNVFKLKHICEQNGLADKYAAGEIHDLDMFHKTGRCVLNVQKGGPKDDGSFYADKNGIQDYLVTGDSAVDSSAKKTAKAQKEARELDDEIPF